MFTTRRANPKDILRPPSVSANADLQDSYSTGSPWEHFRILSEFKQNTIFSVLMASIKAGFEIVFPQDSETTINLRLNSQF